MPYRTSIQTSEHSPGHSSHSNNSNQLPQTMSANQRTAARWLAQGGTSNEGTAHLHHLASMYKRTRTHSGQSQLQTSTDHFNLPHPLQQHAPSEHLSDKELSWNLAQLRQKAVKDHLPIYSPSSSAACADVQAAFQQQQHTSQPLGDLSLFMPLRSMSLQMLSQQIPSMSYDQAAAHPETAGPHGSSGHAQGLHSQSDPLSQSETHQPRSHGSHAFLQSARQQSFASQEQPASELQQTSASGISQQHAFERPHGLSSFSMPFMNAPHSVHSSMQTSHQESTRFASTDAVPMDVCQGHSFSATSGSNADAWQRAMASAAENAVPTHLKPPVILISQVLPCCSLHCYLAAVLQAQFSAWVQWPGSAAYLLSMHASKHCLQRRLIEPVIAIMCMMGTCNIDPFGMAVNESLCMWCGFGLHQLPSVPQKC